MAASLFWLGLVFFSRMSRRLGVSDLIADRGVNPFLCALAGLIFLVAALGLWGARRCWRRDSRGRKILATAIALANCLAFITSMVQFTLLPRILNDLRADAQPYENLVHRQHVLLAATCAAWGLILAFDAACAWVLTRDGSGWK